MLRRPCSGCPAPNPSTRAGPAASVTFQSQNGSAGPRPLPTSTGDCGGRSPRDRVSGEAIAPVTAPLVIGASPYAVVRSGDLWMMNAVVSGGATGVGVRRLERPPRYMTASGSSEAKAAATGCCGPRAPRPGSSGPGSHTFRHTAASRLFAEGRNAVQVQRWLGHHSPSFTLDTYVHLPDGNIGAPLALGAQTPPEPDLRLVGVA
jgi:hypothetical protein